MKKFWKNFDLKFGMAKKSWCPDIHSPQKIQSPECSVNKKILKNFWSQIWCDQNNVGCLEPLPPQKIQSPELLGKGTKFWKIFWLQIRHDQKKLVPRSPPSLKISESRVHLLNSKKVWKI